MFKYGKKAGYMGIALLVLAVLPLVVAAFVIPNIGPEAAGAAGTQPAAERGDVLYGGTPGKEQ